MLKKFFIISVVTILCLYIVATLIFLACRNEETVCKGIDISIIGNEHNILSNEYLENVLKAKNLHPTGKNMKDIDCHMIENAINENSLIKECQSYKTHRNLVGIRIKCKTPIMLVFDKNENGFYIDENGDIIERIHSSIYLPVASGHIEREMADKELLKIALFLKENKFWNEQIEQIYFTERKEVIIIPRIGNHTIELGKTDKLEQKLEKLKDFYEKGLNNIGWNKYSKINIEFENKIIGTKR